MSEYWIVDTVAKNVTVLLCRDDGFEVAAEYGEGENLTSPALPGFALSIDDVFRD